MYLRIFVSGILVNPFFSVIDEMKMREDRRSLRADYELNYICLLKELLRTSALDLQPYLGCIQFSHNLFGRILL